MKIQLQKEVTNSQIRLQEPTLWEGKRRLSFARHLPSQNLILQWSCRPPQVNVAIRPNGTTVISNKSEMKVTLDRELTGSPHNRLSANFGQNPSKGYARHGGNANPK